MKGIRVELEQRVRAANSWGPVILILILMLIAGGSAAQPDEKFKSGFPWSDQSCAMTHSGEKSFENTQWGKVKSVKPDEKFKSGSMTTVVQQSLQCWNI